MRAGHPLPEEGARVSIIDVTAVIREGADAVRDRQASGTSRTKPWAAECSS